MPGPSPRRATRAWRRASKPIDPTSAHPDGRTAIAHLQRRPGEPPTPVASERPGAELPVREARRLCLYDHLAVLRQRIADQTLELVDVA